MASDAHPRPPDAGGRTPGRRPRSRGLVGKLTGLFCVATLPLFLLLAILIWGGAWIPSTGLGGSARWSLTVLVAAWWLGGLWLFRERMVRALQTLANVLSGVRDGDFSFRVGGASRDDAFGEVFLEINALADTLREQRWGALETTALLQTVMAEIDVAVFAFDAGRRLRLVNRAGERMLRQPAERVLGRYAADLGLGECLAGDVPRTANLGFGGTPGRWRIQRLTFRQGGLPHQLLVLSDLSRELREEERQAWQRLVRVLGHELNNSLAPVISIAASLSRLLQRDPRPADWEQDARDGLQVIGSRAESLQRFVGAYAQLARMPRPRPQAVDLRRLAGRVADLETRLPIVLVPSPDVRLEADPDQLEQALINLVRNAADAVLESSDGASVSAPGVRMGWTRVGPAIEIWIEDDGPGLAATANLFVPFYTTKPRGSGIGLVLCQQIAEGHGGSFTLGNRTGARGCRACLRLPASTACGPEA